MPQPYEGLKKLPSTSRRNIDFVHLCYINISIHEMAILQMFFVSNISYLSKNKYHLENASENFAGAIQAKHG